MLGCSVDSVYSHLGWVNDSLGDIQFPMLSDFNKEVTRKYNILKDELAAAYRATFIIDPEGIVRHIAVTDTSVGRSPGEVLRVLQALQTGELCPVDWKPGQKTLGK